MVRILGISAFYHDSAAALIEDGVIVAAAQEERFTRRKHDAAYPRHAADYCLAQAGCRIGDVDYVAFLLPIIVMTALLGGLVVLFQGSAVAPFIYTLF